VDLEKMLARDPISDRGISVILPVFNQAGRVAEFVSHVAAVLDRLSRGYELIVIDDGSSDDTTGSLRDLSANNRRMRLVGPQSRQGNGAALRAGFRLAKYPLVLQLSEAVEIDGDAIERFLRAIDQVDIVCGCRLSYPAGVIRWRYWLYRLVLRVVFGVGVHDVDCGVRLYRRSALRKIAIQSNGRFANAEILAKATFMNMLLSEVAVACSPRTEQPNGGAKDESVLREALVVFRKPQFRVSNTAVEQSEASAG
jgi:dolichyl-phosphate beta-glucosyltransferase